MKSLFRVWTAAILLAVFTGNAPAQEGTPQAFLETIYRTYSSPNSPGVKINTKKQLETYFTPAVVAMIEKDAANSKKKNEPPLLNGDPFIDSQDWDVRKLKINVNNKADTKTTAMVSFVNYGEERQVRLELVKTTAGWRIDDIKWREGTLRGLYKKQ